MLPLSAGRYSELQPSQLFTSGTSSSSALGALAVVFTSSHPFGNPHTLGLRLLSSAWMLLNPPVAHGSCSEPSRMSPWRHSSPTPGLAVLSPGQVQGDPGLLAATTWLAKGLYVIANMFCAINNLAVMIEMTTAGRKARLAVALAVEELLWRDPPPRGVPCLSHATVPLQLGGTFGFSPGCPAAHLVLCCSSLWLL